MEVAALSSLAWHNPTENQPISRMPRHRAQATELEKRRQFFIRVHNESLSVSAMCVGNPDRSPVGINR
jgi:hypothetical protein